MVMVVVERSFAEPVVLTELKERQLGAAWCFDTQGVRFVRGFCARDRRSVVCTYEAPDAEAVRATQRRANVPVLRCWSAIPVIEQFVAPPPGFSLVVAQRELPA